MHFSKDEQEQGPEGVEGDLTGYAQMREEREGEVRLYFRDVPANEVARHLWSSGAMFISLMAERSTEKASNIEEYGEQQAEGETEEWEGPHSGGAPQTQHKTTPQRDGVSTGEGELTMRYFFALGEIVYTVNLVVPSGVVDSVAGIYPSAARLEREVAQRMSVVIRT